MSIVDWTLTSLYTAAAVFGGGGLWYGVKGVLAVNSGSAIIKASGDPFNKEGTHLVFAVANENISMMWGGVLLMYICIMIALVVIRIGVKKGI